ncbi:MAG: septum formation initiator family protein [Bacteroidota bacterium]
MKKTENSSFKEKITYWKHRLRFFRNKYIFTITVFTIFALFLDDNDIFTLISQNSKLNKIQTDQQIVAQKLRETRYTLKQLTYSSELERYAREEKLFKKDDEDIFILSYE